ncbi:MAG: GldG family protein [Clostridiales bacterium]|mgnify:CR=1 FL=1|nr:GldG family protein [Clostridiales bacterium]
MKSMNRLKQSLKVNLVFTLLVVLLIAGVFLLNGIAMLLTDRYSLSVDLTENAAYEIGEDTKALLQDLKQPVEIFVLSTEDAFGGSNYLNQAKRIIQQYPRHGETVSLTFVDYASNPSFAAGFADLTLSSGDVIVRCGQRVKQIAAQNLFHYQYTADGKLTIASSRAEEALTSALLNVTSDRLVRVAVLTGNGVVESKLFTALLADNNYQVAPVNLTTESLDGYDGALLFAPATDLSEDALRKLESFLFNGGQFGKTLFYAASASQGVLPNLDAFLSEWGVSFGTGAVFETRSERTYQYQPFYPMADYADERYRRMLRDPNTPFLMPLSRPMQLLFRSKDGYYTETLLSFGETSGVRPANAGADFSADQTTVKGPLPALALCSYNAKGTGGASLRSCVIVSASAGIFDSIALQNTSLTDSEYLLLLLGDLLGQEAQISIEPKSLSGKVLGITSAQASTLGALLAGLLPLLILATGVVVWLVRRYR